MKRVTTTYDTVVIGGGFFGCMIAQHLEGKILILEREADILKKASVNNQARVHNGYHYPRSFLTAVSSHKNYSKFIQEFKAAVVPGHTMLYPIAKGSKVSAKQYWEQYQTIGCPIKVADEKYAQLFNSDLIDTVYEVDELVFDGNILRDLVKGRLADHKTTIIHQEVISISPHQVKTAQNTYTAKRIILCAYGDTNKILSSSDLVEVPVIIEDTVMPLINVPSIFKNLGITIMDGDFFSIMPFPMQQCHSIHHVKLTPENAPFQKFQEDIEKYIPSLKNLTHIGDITEKKVIFPGSAMDDGRPILYRKNYAGNDWLEVIVGGKLDNIYDILDVMDGKENKYFNVI